MPRSEAQAREPDRDRHARLIRLIGAILLLVGLLSAATFLVLQQRVRPGTWCAIALGVLVLTLLRLKQTRRATLVLCWGSLAVGLIGAATTTGLRGVGLIVLPIACLIAGWLLGRRAALALAAGSTAGILLLYGLHRLDWSFDQQMSLEPIMVALIGATVASALLGNAIADGFGQQLSATERAWAQLRESEATFRRLFEDTHQPTALLTDHRFTAVNNALLAMLHLERADQVIGRTPADISPPRQTDGSDSAAKSLQIAELIAQQGWADFEWELRRADGEAFDAQIQMTRIMVNQQPVSHAVFRDVSEQKKAQAQIEHLAYHDTLTGLPNRMLGRDRLQQALAAAARDQGGLALLSLDLDHFKNVNDTHGHHAGDLLLQAVAERLRSSTRQADTVCRLAGDEFLVVMPGLCESHQISEVCERIIERLRQPVPLQGTLVNVGTSIGIAIHPRDGLDAETLMLNADTALYEAKKDRLGRYRYFEPRMNAELAHYLETRQALQLALEREEFELHYQPQIDLRSGVVLGAEALLRWQRPGHGLVMPDHFIRVAEDSGLMERMGRWVLQRACQQAVAWQAAGVGRLVIGVNLSATQFRHDGLDATIMAALAASGLPPAQLELELTESTLLQLDTPVQEMMARWKAAGIRLAIDDFGTGYSNLAYLKQLAVDKIKIDRSFVLNLNQEAQDRAIVGAMIQVANKLGLRCIAEGIESEDTARLLREMGCDEAQGYWYARPLSAPEFERWLKAAQPNLTTAQAAEGTSNPGQSASLRFQPSTPT